MKRFKEILQQLREEKLEEDFKKRLKRGLQGWNGPVDPGGLPQTPKDVIKRVDAMPKEYQKDLASRNPKYPHSPQGLQSLRAKRNLKLGKLEEDTEYE